MSHNLFSPGLVPFYFTGKRTVLILIKSINPVSNNEFLLNFVTNCSISKFLMNKMCLLQLLSYLLDLCLGPSLGNKTPLWLRIKTLFDLVWCSLKV